MNFLPTRSAIQHSRFAFSFFLLPVYVFALSQAPHLNLSHAFLIFIVWHLFIYPASNGYNSYFDKDESSIALLEKPPLVDKSLYVFSLTLDVTGVILALFISPQFAAAALIYGLLSKLYSHPSVRLKKYPIISFLVVFIFQGAFVYWTSYYALSEISIFESWDILFIIAGLICSCLIGASYPLTQIYQHDEDTKRGDKTLSIVLGVNGSFAFAAFLFATAVILMFIYWNNLDKLQNFWMFIPFMLPVLFVFVMWMLKALKEKSQANFKNMSRMTMVSGTMMLLYFLLVLWIEKF